MNVQQKAM